MFKTKIPFEVEQIIMMYANVKLRNGIYMTQIEKTDPRYNIVKNIPKIETNTMNLHNKTLITYSVYLKNHVKITFNTEEYEKVFKFNHQYVYQCIIMNNYLENIEIHTTKGKYLYYFKNNLYHYEINDNSIYDVYGELTNIVNNL